MRIMNIWEGSGKHSQMLFISPNYIPQANDFLQNDTQDLKKKPMKYFGSNN